MLQTLLQDILSQQPVLDDLKEKSQYLPEKSDKIETFLSSAQSKHSDVLQKAKQTVEDYERIVNDHYQYTKAVMETTEWLTATANTVEMWGDNTLERLSLHANLERLTNLQVKQTLFCIINCIINECFFGFLQSRFIISTLSNYQ